MTSVLAVTYTHISTLLLQPDLRALLKFKDETERGDKEYPVTVQQKSGGIMRNWESTHSVTQKIWAPTGVMAGWIWLGYDPHLSAFKVWRTTTYQMVTGDQFSALDQSSFDQNKYTEHISPNYSLFLTHTYQLQLVLKHMQSNRSWSSSLWT